MIKAFTIAITTVILINAVQAQPDKWTQKHSLYNLVAGRNGAVGFSINGKGYIGTGFSFGFGDDGGWNNDLWQYDTATNSWTQMASMPVAGRQAATAFVINGKAYVGCGATGYNPPRNDLWEYNPVKNSWKKKANIPNSGLAGPLSFTLNNKAYVGFGTDSAGYYQRGIWEYDAKADTWTRKKDFPALTVYESFAMSDSAYGYAGLGYDVHTFRYATDVWQYDAATDTWTQKNDFGGKPRTSEAYFTVNNTLYIVGGENAAYTGFLKDVWSYNSATDSWTNEGNFTGPVRGGAVGFSIGDKGYIGTGFDAISNPRELGDFWEMDTKTMHWRQRADLGGGPRDFAVSFKLGNKGIVATGEDGTRFKKDVWSYDAVNDSWKRLPDLVYGKRNATGFSINAKMYIGLGQLDTSRSIIFPINNSKDFWVFDSSSKAWTQIADFGGGNRGTATAFVLNDKAYVGTGFADDGVLTKDFWQYDPSTNRWKQKASLPGNARSTAISFVINGKGYAGMGVSKKYILQDLYEYDPSTDQWTAKASFGGKAIAYNVAVAVGNYGYVGLGVDYNSNYLKDWWQFDPVANTWTKKTNFPSRGRWAASAVNIGNSAYVGMGVVDTLYCTNDWYEYSPEAPVRIAKENYNADSLLDVTADCFQWMMDNNGDLVWGIKTQNENGKLINWNISNAAINSLQQNSSKTQCLNRVINITSKNHFSKPVTIRIYATEKEITDFLKNYNEQHHTSFTEKDLSIITVNNDGETSIQSSVGNYGLSNEYRYFEFATTDLTTFKIGFTEKTIASTTLPAKVWISSNPFSSSFQLRVISKKDDAFNVSIQDESGKIRETKTVRANELNAFGNSLTHGAYFVYVGNNSVQLPAIKVIKE